MIEQRNIVENDFSLALPNTSRKLLAVSAALTAALDVDNGGGQFTPDELFGFGLMLYEIYEDLKTMEGALYPQKNKA